jgi:hypothetical protein
MLVAHQQKGAMLMIYCPLRPAKRTLVVLLGWLLMYPSIGVAEVKPKSESPLHLAARSKTVKRVKTTTKIKRTKAGKRKVIKKKTVKKKSVRRSKKPVEIPIDIGIGPAVHQFTGPVQRAQQYHTGLKLSLAAIIDQSVIASQAHKIPKKYRGLAKKIGTVRFRPGPLILVPDTIFISPAQEDTGIYGANWRPIAVGLPISILNLGTGLNMTYAYLTGSDENPKTHFVRPGLDLTANVEIPFSRSFLVSFGWTSFLYPPQAVGGEVFALGDLDESIWHIGQAYFRLHFRIPYTVNL